MVCWLECLATIVKDMKHIRRLVKNGYVSGVEIKNGAIVQEGDFLKKILCFMWFNHRQSVNSMEDARGKEFRYVSSCRCGKHVTKSVLLHDNDLLSNINLNSHNFPIDEKLSTTR